MGVKQLLYKHIVIKANHSNVICTIMMAGLRPTFESSYNIGEFLTINDIV